MVDFKAQEPHEARNAPMTKMSRWDTLLTLGCRITLDAVPSERKAESCNAARECGRIYVLK